MTSVALPSPSASYYGCLILSFTCYYGWLDEFIEESNFMVLEKVPYDTTFSNVEIPNFTLNFRYLLKDRRIALLKMISL